MSQQYAKLRALVELRTVRIGRRDGVGTTILRGCGLELADVAAVRVFLRHFDDDYARMNAVYATYYPQGRRPARTCIGSIGARNDSHWPRRRCTGRDRLDCAPSQRLTRSLSAAVRRPDRSACHTAPQFDKRRRFQQPELIRRDTRLQKPQLAHDARHCGAPDPPHRREAQPMAVDVG